MENNQMEINKLTQNRGQRIKSLRQTLRYSRRAFAQRHQLKAATIQSWEDGRYGGLTEQGARVLAQAFREEGLKVYEEWLMHGHGEDPLATTATTRESPAKNSIETQLQQFLNQHPNAIDAFITDDALAPLLLPGDLVAGVRHFQEEIEQALNQVCIVQLKNNQLLIRYVTTHQKPGYIQLKPTNPKSTLTNQTVSQQDIFSLAPIVWFRRTSNSHISCKRTTNPSINF